MKKLLITVIGAAAALGASAGAISTQQFETEEVGTTKTIELLNAGGTYWSGDDLTNTYEIVAVSSTPEAYSLANPPTKGLGIKTTFGNPLTLKAKTDGSGTTIPASGLYFDSVVKFTVCDAGQNADMYDGAKIVMWLEQNEAETQTNLIVRAGYLSLSGGTVTSTPTNYVCALPSDFNIDAWHRVTIKAINDITVDGLGVPGFAIYIDQMDQEDTTPMTDRNCIAAKWDSSFTADLVEAAAMLNVDGALFPTLDLTSGSANVSSLRSVSFDGTGALTDTCFTDDGPVFAKDIVAPKASVKIGDANAKEYGSLAEAVAAVSGLTDGQTATLKLIKGVTLEEPLTINADFGTVIIDFAGNVWTNALTDAAITNNAAELVITNSVGNGGIYCTDRADGVAIYNDGGLTIYGGTINGLFEIGENGTNIEIFGGSFLSDNVGSYLAEGLTLDENAETGLYDVVYTWAGFLGKAVDGAYTIDDAADILALQKGVLAGIVTADVTFKQTANIDMTGVEDFYGIGWFESSTSFASVPTGVASDGKTTLPFAGTYDGQGYTISNVTIVRHNYAGVFNNVSGTVKNLTVQDIGFSGTCSEWGCAIVGNAASGSLLENLTAVTSSSFNWGDSANHNVAGVVVRPIGAATIRGCVNNANISATAKRVGGIASFVGSGATGTVFDSCTNNAALVSTDGTRGVGGILGCAEGGVKNSPTDADTIIRNCVDFGSETAQASGGHAGAIVGSNWNESYTYTDDGGNTFKASTVDCGYAKNVVFGRAFAVESTINTVAYLTTVKAADLAAGNTYKVMASDATATFEFTAAGTIAFDTALATPTFAITAAEGLTLTDATVGTVKTYTATAAGPTPITPESGATNVTIHAESIADATNKVVIAAPAGSNISGEQALAAYKDLFVLSAKDNSDGTFTVTIDGIKEEKVAAVEADAVTTLLDSEDSTVAVPAGLYYKITPSTALPISGTPTKGVSTGSVSVTKPESTAQGFFEVKLSPTPID